MLLLGCSELLKSFWPGMMVIITLTPESIRSVRCLPASLDTNTDTWSETVNTEKKYTRNIFVCTMCHP